MTFILIVPLVGQTCLPIVVGAIVFALFYFAFHERKSRKYCSNYSDDLSVNSKTKELSLSAGSISDESNSTSSNESESESKVHDHKKPHLCSTELQQKISSVKIWYSEEDALEVILDELCCLMGETNIPVEHSVISKDMTLKDDATLLYLFLMRGASTTLLDALKAQDSQGQKLNFIYHICSFQKESLVKSLELEEIENLLVNFGGQSLKNFGKFRVDNRDEEHKFSKYMKKLARLLKNSTKKCCGACIKRKQTVDIEDLASSIPTKTSEVQQTT